MSTCAAFNPVYGGYAEFMSDGHVLQNVRPSPAQRAVTHEEENLSRAREKLSRYLPRAIEIMTELAETSENDRVRLAAAESIADRAGLGKSAVTQVVVTQSEHDAARLEAEAVMQRIRENQDAITKGATNMPFDVLIVLEGETATEGV